MARQRQYDDPISIPFTFERKGEITQLAADHPVAPADIVRWCVDAAFDDVKKKIEDGTLR